ncbi:MAG: hypothetical protein HC879_02410 [Leptolyngbyaceae cyanobacterium SL_5_9]|nr:hypothetical protein [Leptolyngbyaceae cyanobacterium SL_5_9]NJO73028.1 hypothetical protein [Leptolyngbyaceae cyanobacterium RM1_406_9]
MLGSAALHPTYGTTVLKEFSNAKEMTLPSITLLWVIAGVPNSGDQSLLLKER